MGYHTDFEGSFQLDKPLSLAHAAYLHAFSGTRRMKRNVVIAEKLPDNPPGKGMGSRLPGDNEPEEGISDKLRRDVGLPLGVDAGYFVGGGWRGQNDDESILEYNYPPSGQPGLWCQWIPSADGTCIEWDGGEKFYNYVEWLQYIIHHFLATWGYVLNGEVTWQGEESDDRGKIVVVNNEVTTRQGRIVYDGEDD